MASERSARAIDRLRIAQAQLDEARSGLESVERHRVEAEIRKEVESFYKQDAKDRQRAVQLLARLSASHAAAKTAFESMDAQKEQILETHGDVAYRDARTSPRLSAAEREVSRRADELEEKADELAEKKRLLSRALNNAAKHEAMFREIDDAAKRGDEKTVSNLASKLSSAKTLRGVLMDVDPTDEAYSYWDEESMSFSTVLGADMDVFLEYRELRREDAEQLERAQDLVARRQRAVQVHEREVSRLGREGFVGNAHGEAGIARYYVWVLAPYSDTPLSSEGPYGPHPLRIAEQMARIGATEGAHDRAVSLGGDPEAHGFCVERRYQARSGKRIV